MSETCYKNLVFLMNLILNSIHEATDIANAMRLMILSQTFYYEHKEGGASFPEKKFLQVGIQQHDFWKSSNFWREAIKGIYIYIYILDAIKEELEEQEKFGLISENSTERKTRCIICLWI